MEVLRKVVIGALVLGSIIGFIALGIAYWSVVGPFLVGIWLLLICYFVGDMIR